MEKITHAGMHVSVRAGRREWIGLAVLALLIAARALLGIAGATVTAAIAAGLMFAVLIGVSWVYRRETFKTQRNED